jgi:GNAT superfamily N-acetyltransferase
LTNPSPHLEILDLRHFSAAQLKPLLRDEASRWQRRLFWDYTRSSALLLDYLDSRILPGFVALRAGNIVGYAFCVFEGAKAVIGDVYALGETESTLNPICDTLLHHLLEFLHATPGVDRIESQLLMFPDGALAEPFHSRGFQSFPRLFMLRHLTAQNDRPLDRPQRAERPLSPDPTAPNPDTPNPALSLPKAPRPTPPPTPPLLLQSWQPEFYDATADLIHRCYAGHMDAGINDQYRTLQGAQRFLHNIIRFPGCGVFETENSLALRHTGSFAVEAILLCSRVRSDVDHITQLCVSPALRGHRLGQALLDHCAAESSRHGVKHLTLTVTEANTAALHLYEHNGFTTLHRFEAMVWEAHPRKA